jgi:valyl-tRNA synthetase
VRAVIVCEKDEVRQVLDERRDYLTGLAGISEIEFAEDAPGAGFGMRVVVEGAEAYLSWESGVDAGEEIDRLARRLAKVSSDLERTLAKLANAGFVSKAPPAVIEKEREKERELTETRQKLNDQIEALEKAK